MMSIDEGAPIEGRDQLVAYFEAGCKPKDEWRIGTEHEKFVFRCGDFGPLPYVGNPGVRDILKSLEAYGWQPVTEGENVIALNRGASGGHKGGSITLEPGGQLELSGAPVANLHETCAEVNTHLAQMRAIGKDLDIGMLGIGFHPTWTRDEIPWMPKGRYSIMRDYMPKVGTLGHDMMLRTSTVQVNLDYADEADMARKFRTALALQPVATALFANSPFVEGKPSGYLSYRAHVWTDTDPARAGFPAFVFDDGFGFERYTDYILDVPMYFVARDGAYIDASGQSFRDFLAGKLPALPGQLPRLGDWIDHISTAFPEVRLKQYLEMRGADSGPWRRICALPALWTGLLYDETALDAVAELTADWTAARVTELHADAAKYGLGARLGDTSLVELARQILKIARQGLTARARLDVWGEDEGKYLATLEQTADTGLTPAELKLEAYRGRWGGDIQMAFKEYAF
ncbi:MAG: glutamate--cysteine ligase [Alphaproteobacteria bacterium]|nr:glutamate--cysteine ligase [Alphaproteobacteria bacterium]